MAGTGAGWIGGYGARFAEYAVFDYSVAVSVMDLIFATSFLERCFRCWRGSAFERIIPLSMRRRCDFLLSFFSFSLTRSVET